MSLRVFIAGGFFHSEDLRYLPGAAELDFDAKNEGLSVIGDVDDYFDRASRADLAIFVTHGVKLEKFFAKHGDNPKVRAFFSNSGVRKVMWSVDAHHLWPKEVAFQHCFDRLYVADTSVMRHYQASKVAWLPCYYRFLPIDKLIEKVSRDTRTHRAIIFPHHIHAIGNRNQIARQIKRLCDQRPLESLFGNVGPEETYLEMMLSSRVCLNVSLLSEVNLRTFEALAYNRVLLADACPDYQNIEADWSSAIFYHRHLGGFAERLEAANSIPPESVNSLPSIVNRHTITHRYLEIINRECGTNYKMNQALPESKVGLPATFPNCLPPPATPSLWDKLRARMV